MNTAQPGYKVVDVVRLAMLIIWRRTMCLTDHVDNMKIDLVDDVANRFNIASPLSFSSCECFSPRCSF